MREFRLYCIVEQLRLWQACTYVPNHQSIRCLHIQRRDVLYLGIRPTIYTYKFKEFVNPLPHRRLLQTEQTHMLPDQGLLCLLMEILYI